MKRADSTRVAQLEEVTGYTFKKKDLALTSLTHCSYHNDEPEAADNQRLEFLGDAVLQLCCASLLYREFDADEGVLTRLRAALVCKHALAGYAGEMKLAEMARTSRTETAITEGRLSDIYEAVLGAVYLDGGFAAAYTLAEKHIKGILSETSKLLVDDKSALQEYAAKMRWEAPVYHSLHAQGPSHKPLFASTVAVNGTPAGEGQGPSKKEAEKAAAHAALQKFGQIS